MFQRIFQNKKATGKRSWLGYLPGVPTNHTITFKLVKTKIQYPLITSFNSGPFEELGQDKK